MATANFDFQRYVDKKKNPGGGHEARGGFGDYAFSGDLRVLRRLDRLAPVRIVVESTVRLWKNFRKNELLGTSVKVSSRQFPHLHAQIVACAEILDIPAPTAYVTENPHVNADTFGTNTEAFVVLNSALVDKFDEQEMKFVIGHECGHIQNNHVVYHTAARFMAQGAGLYLKYASLPASMALDAWSRRGVITCDRAGLICCRDLDSALKAMMKTALGSHKLFEEMDLDEFLGQLEGVKEGWGRFAELMQSDPYVPKRVRALKLFAESAYFQSLIGERGGRPLDEIDREVDEVLQVL